MAAPAAARPATLNKSDRFKADVGYIKPPKKRKKKKQPGERKPK